ncbi:MAG TPA: AAA family ATPase [Planctomycetota bacterium]
MISVAAPTPRGGGRTEWLAAELARPAAYAHPVQAVEVRRTLVSLLFFAGERVYKVKQELDLGFIDASTLALRRFLCAEEVRLNARLAPGVHLGVVPITRGPDGHLRFGSAGAKAQGEPVEGETVEGEVVEWAVEMVRLPAELMLASLLERGVVDNAQMNALAELLAAFHAEAPAGLEVAELGTPASIALLVEENFEQLRAFVGHPDGPLRSELEVLTPAQHAFLRTRARGFLARERELLLARVAGGRIREGHGDLHAENICQLPQGFVVYDRIEFNRRLRCLDVASDVAFLVMDLDARGFPGFGAYLAHRYAERAQDPELGRVLGFYKGYRALVRAKVAALAATRAGTHWEQREELRRQAMRYAQLAVGYELPPTLVLLSGLPGSGKSFLAPHLAGPLRGGVLHSDERRKRLAGLAAGASARASWGTGLYTPERRLGTYRALLEDALAMLQAGRSVVVDASFARAEFRQPFVDAAVRLGVPWCLARVEAPEDIVRARLAARTHGPSDADFEVYRHERAAFEAPDELPGGHVLTLASMAGPPEELVSQVLERLIHLGRAT